MAEKQPNSARPTCDVRSDAAHGRLFLLPGGREAHLAARAWPLECLLADGAAGSQRLEG